ncbi:DMT family transporter [Acuticoccus sp. MNP-M23]|uniref:DMT family transporter n=1 Tax=Acuticoccus sp. MNP-M23 TaxID=3072793 RepID=UPI002814F429|nr:DMT family transporter [Acuticoccus sp. MNP-M23]WMS44606.1 DMT family transporter [Acuticoccus sp. MNP-M23]
MKDSLAAFLGLAAYAVLSTHDVIVKGLGATFSPIQIVFFSALMGFPIITFYLIGDPTQRRLRPVHPWWVVLRSISGTTSAICAFYAFAVLPLSEAYSFIFATPLLITLFAVPLLGERIRLRRGLAILVGLVGVLIVLRPGVSAINSGHIAALCAAFCAALNAVIVRKISNDEHVVVMVLYPMITNLLVTAFALPFVYVDVKLVDLSLFGLTSLLVLCGMTLMVSAYSRGSAIVVAPMQYSQMIWGSLFGVILFGEWPVWQTYLGVAIIVGSGIYILKREATQDVSRTTPVLSTKTRMGHAVALRVSSLLRLRQDGEAARKDRPE